MPTFGTAAEKFGKLTAKVEEATKAVVALTAAAVPAATAIDNIGMAMKETSAFMRELKIAMSMALVGADARVSDPDLGQHRRSEQDQKDANIIVASLTKLQHELEGVFGSNNQFAYFLGKAVASILGGADPWAVLDALRGQFSVFEAGLLQEEWSSDPTIAALARELDRFIHGGQLN